MDDGKEQRPRARDLGLIIGDLTPGPLNAITDVPDVRVGHVSLVEGEGELVPGAGPVRTGVTAILPHGGNLFTEKVCAAADVINGFGKSTGLPQVMELGNIETPIALTNTLNVWSVADALVDYVSEENPGVYSFNPVVGECNDSYLNDTLGRHVKRAHVFEALGKATRDNVEEGVVGAGVGMSGFGWKAGIGTSSRILPAPIEAYSMGALVLTNTGRSADLRLDGIPFGRECTPDSYESTEGSIMMILGTDAPLSARQVGRIARRAAMGLGRIGGTAGHGSGDFAIAFTTGNRVSPAGEQSARPEAFVPEPQLSQFFRATVDVTEEAILNSLLRAETATGRDGNTRFAIPISRVREAIERHRGVKGDEGP